MNIETERPQADREILGLAQEIGVGPADALMASHQREALGDLFDRPAQQRPDGLADERRRTRAVNVGLRERGHGVRSQCLAGRSCAGVLLAPP